MAQVLTEGPHTGGFLVWEAFRDYCREVVTIAAGTLEPGTVLGKITASGNYAPELVQGLVRKARRSATSATEAQAQLTKLSLVIEEHGIPGVKAAAEATGLKPGSPRKPLKRLPKRTAEAIPKALGF